MGAVVPLTGRYGAGGAQIRAGYEIAVEQINAAGGVTVGATRMPIELILQDDESDATKTVARLEGLAAQGVVGYLGGFGSDLHAAAASVAEKNRVPYLGVAFALQKIHQQGFRYLFSPFWKSPDIGQATQGLLELIPAAERPKTVAIFQEKTDWGREMAAAWTEAGKGAGYQVVVTGEYAPGAKDFSDIILKARTANADAVLALPTPPDGMTIVKQMKELGYSPEARALHPRPRRPDLVAEPRQGRRLHGARGGLASRDEGRGREGAERRAPEEDSAAPPIPWWARPTPACRSWPPRSRARAGLDREKVRDAVAATSMNTAVGAVKFRPDGTGIVQQALLQWINGKQELVWPKDVATAPLAFPAPPFAKR